MEFLVAAAGLISLPPSTPLFYPLSSYRDYPIPIPERCLVSSSQASETFPSKVSLLVPDVSVHLLTATIWSVIETRTSCTVYFFGAQEQMILTRRNADPRDAEHLVDRLLVEDPASIEEDLDKEDMYSCSWTGTYEKTSYRLVSQNISLSLSSSGKVLSPASLSSCDFSTSRKCISPTKNSVYIGSRLFKPLETSVLCEGLKIAFVQPMRVGYDNGIHRVWSETETLEFYVRSNSTGPCDDLFVSEEGYLLHFNPSLLSLPLTNSSLDHPDTEMFYEDVQCQNACLTPSDCAQCGVRRHSSSQKKKTWDEWKLLHNFQSRLTLTEAEVQAAHSVNEAQTQSDVSQLQSALCNLRHLLWSSFQSTRSGTLAAQYITGTPYHLGTFTGRYIRVWDSARAKNVRIDPSVVKGSTVKAIYVTEAGEEQIGGLTLGGFIISGLSGRQNSIPAGFVPFGNDSYIEIIGRTVRKTPGLFNIATPSHLSFPDQNLYTPGELTNGSEGILEALADIQIGDSLVRLSSGQGVLGNHRASNLLAPLKSFETWVNTTWMNWVVGFFTVILGIFFCTCGIRCIQVCWRMGKAPAPVERMSHRV
ncbi:putative glycoprotein [Wenling crustacean virus 11]|uniref:Putative glycoprotein n=1 Tax=Wenling crustacean virus 11 TaxID=1923480 RepID=A0A1L3KNF7_9RHAB|nr:putative glycoprotein [Wenling crustacean virus 11]APG78835.1 putative glycoprotein [Wenling crustacean virus 11]